MKLSILIPTLPERANSLKRLTNILNPQIARFPGEIDLRMHDAGPAIPTGRKRNSLIEQTESDYFCFIDDDDVVAINYIDEVMKGIATGADVITFNGWYTEFGRNRRNFTIRLGSKYYEDPTHPEFYYHRFPNHLAVFKREKVNMVKFPDLWQREDYIWAEQIATRNLLKTEYHIPQFLYHYDCHPKHYVSRVKVR